MATGLVYPLVALVLVLYASQLTLGQFEGPPPLPLPPMHGPIGPGGMFIDELAPYGGHPPAIVTAGVHRPSANNYPIGKKTEYESSSKTKDGDTKNKSKKQSDKNKEKNKNKEFDSSYKQQESIGSYGPIQDHYEYDHEDHKEKHGKKEFKATTTTPAPGAWSSLSNAWSRLSSLGGASDSRSSKRYRRDVATGEPANDAKTQQQQQQSQGHEQQKDEQQPISLEQPQDTQAQQQLQQELLRQLQMHLLLQNPHHLQQLQQQQQQQQQQQEQRQQEQQQTTTSEKDSKKVAEATRVKRGIPEAFLHPPAITTIDLPAALIKEATNKQHDPLVMQQPPQVVEQQQQQQQQVKVEEKPGVQQIEQQQQQQQVQLEERPGVKQIEQQQQQQQVQLEERPGVKKIEQQQQQQQTSVVGPSSSSSKDFIAPTATNQQQQQQQQVVVNNEAKPAYTRVQETIKASIPAQYVYLKVPKHLICGSH